MAVAEVDKNPSAILKHHYPDVPNLGDVTKITEEQIKALGHIDVVVFGFPCQDLSVAGKRAGLHNAEGETTRSGLFFTAMQIARWSGARWTLAENVPGIFSSKKGADFAAVVGEMAGESVDIPKGGWKKSGFLLGSEGLVQWAVLDAQYFGVAQRRRRVFIVRDTGDWRSTKPLFLEQESLLGNPAPSREARQDVTRDASKGSGVRSHWDGDDYPHPTLNQCAKGTGGVGSSNQEVFSQRGAYLVPCKVSPVLGTSTSNVPHCLNAGGMGRIDYESETMVITKAGYSSSETHTLPVGAHIHGTDGTTSVMSFTEVCSALRSRIPSGVENSTTTAVLDNAPHPVSVLTLGHTKSNGLGVSQAEVANTLEAVSGSGQGVHHRMAIRRLTPTECERLQGFPDGYTLIPAGKKMMADGPRYKALGNSFAVPVIRWIGMRLETISRP